MSKTCPKCGLVHSDSILQCECKYVFQNSKQDTFGNDNNKYDKFGGWLIFFAIVCWIRILVFAVGAIAFGLAIIESKTRIEQIENSLWMLLSLIIFILAILIIKIIKVRELDTVVKIRSYLRLGFLITLIFSIVGIVLEISISEEIKTAVKDIISEAGWVALWTSYYEKSNRVRFYYTKKKEEGSPVIKG